jgi:hypothetical protein
MHRLHALRLALLCCAVVAVLAGCGGSKVQYNYASLANEICGTWTDATNSNPPPAVRLKAIETALSGLQGLNPPNTVENLYAELLYHFNAAVNILKPNMVTLTRLANHLQNQPDDKSAQRRYAALGGLRIQHHLQSAANIAHTLALGRCEAAFGGSSS